MRTAVLSTGRRAMVALAVLLGLVAAAAAPAAAHTALAGAVPQPGSTVQQLDEIRLQFGTPLLPDGRHEIQLLGPDGARWDTGLTQVVTDRELGITVVAELAQPGQYTVRWCATPPDGHWVSGAYQFSYTGPATPSAGPSAPAPEAAIDCTASGNGGSAALTGWLLVAVLAGSVLLLTVIVLRSRRAG